MNKKKELLVLDYVGALREASFMQYGIYNFALQAEFSY